eukprot:COSAG02_NODE_704_length_18279_cov_100.299560_2_plen_1731_part_00
MSMGAERPQTSSAGERCSGRSGGARGLPLLALYSDRTVRLDDSFGDRQQSGEGASAAMVSAAVEPPPPRAAAELRPQTTGALPSTGSARSWFEGSFPAFPCSAQRALLFHKTSRVSRGLAARRAFVEEERQKKAKMETRTAATIKIQAIFRGKKARMRYQAKQRADAERLWIEDARQEAAIKIQAVFRGSQHRRVQQMKKKKRKTRNSKQGKHTHRLAKRQQRAHRQKRKAEQRKRRAKNKQKAAKQAQKQAEKARLAAEEEAKEAKRAAEEADKAAKAARERIKERKLKAKQKRKEMTAARHKQTIASKKQRAATEMQCKSLAQYESMRVQLEADGQGRSPQAAATDTAHEREEQAKQQRIEALQLFAKQLDPIEPKPMLLVKHQITKLLEAKVVDDANKDHLGHVRQSFPGFICQRFQADYGLPEMTERNLFVFLEGVREYAASTTHDDVRLIQLFGQLSCLLDTTGVGIPSVEFATSTCDFVLDFLGALVPNHKAIDETLRDNDVFVATNDAMQALSSLDALWELTLLPKGLHKQLKDMLHDELQRSTVQHEGSCQLRIEDCLHIGLHCWCTVMMQSGVTGDIERYEATPELRKQALKRILQKEVDLTGAVDVMQMLKQKHDAHLEHLGQAKQDYDDAKNELDKAAIAAESSCAEEEEASAELQRLERLKLEAKHAAIRAEERAAKRSKEATDKELELKKADQEAEKAEADWYEADTKEYEAIHELGRVVEEQEREEEQQLNDELAAIMAVDDKVRHKLEQETQEAEEARLQAEKEQHEADEAARIYAKELEEAQEARGQRQKEEEDYKKALKAVQLQELKAVNARERADKQLTCVTHAIKMRAKAHERLESEWKDAKNAAFSRRSTTKRKQAMAMAEEGQLDAAAKLQVENVKYKKLNQEADREEAILMERRKELDKELAEFKAAETKCEKEEREAKEAKMRADIEAAEAHAAKTKAAHEQAEADQARTEWEEHERIRRELIRNRLRRKIELVLEQVRIQRDRKREADRKIEQARLQGEELLKEELVKTHQMDVDTFEQVREKAREWKDANPQGHADIMDLIAAWVYSMGPGGAEPNFCACEFQKDNGPPPWNEEPKGSCTCKASATNFRIYPDLNRSMRSITVTGRAHHQFEWLHYHLTQACEHVPGAAKDQKLYRGQQKLYGKWYSVGDIIRWNDYKSTSTNRSAAADFAGMTGMLFTIVDIPSDFGANFNSVPPLSAWPNEDEILLPAGATFRVKMHNTACQCRYQEKHLLKEEPKHTHAHDIVLEYVGQWYDEDSNAAYAEEQGKGCKTFCGCFERLSANRNSERENKYYMDNRVPVKSNQVVPSEPVHSFSAGIQGADSESEQELDLKPESLLEPSPRQEIGPGLASKMQSVADANPSRSTLHGSRSMADALSVGMREERERKVMSEHFPLRFELVVEQKRMSPDLYDSIEAKMKRWLKTWRIHNSNVAQGGTMRLEDAIAAWTYSMGGPQEESISVEAPRHSTNEHCEISHKVCIRDIFLESMAIATKHGTQPRSRWFENDFGRFWKHLKNAISAVAWGSAEVYLGWGAADWQQRQSRGDGYDPDSSVTWLEFVQATTDREKAVQQAGRQGAVLAIRGLPEQAGANFSRMGLSPWNQRLTDVLLVPGIQLRVMSHKLPAAATRRAGGGRRAYSLLTLKFEALQRARARAAAGDDSDASSESDWDDDSELDASTDEPSASSDDDTTETSGPAFLQGTPTGT